MQKVIRKVYIATPFESCMTKRGDRLPKLADFLVKNGYQVEYITTNFNHAEKKFFTRIKILNCVSSLPYKLIVLKALGYKSNISVQRILAHVFLAIRYSFYLLKHLKFNDVLLVPSRPAELIFCVAVLGRLRRIVSILDITDIWPDMLMRVNRFKFYLFKTYCDFFLYFSLKRINRFVHTAPSFVEWLRRYVPKAHSVLIPLGYDADRWQHMRLKETCAKNKISLVYVGLLQHQIDVMPILEALLCVKRCNLTLVGDSGEGGRFSEVQRYIKSHKMTNVIIVGKLSREKLVDCLRQYDVGVVPMISNSIPNKVFDYIASYLPIMALGKSDTSDLVTRYDIGWKLPFVCRQIKEFLMNLTEEKIMEKSKNIEIIKHLFDRENLYKKYVELISNA